MVTYLLLRLCHIFSVITSITISFNLQYMRKDWQGTLLSIQYTYIHRINTMDDAKYPGRGERKVCTLLRCEMAFSYLGMC